MNLDLIEPVRTLPEVEQTKVFPRDAHHVHISRTFVYVAAGKDCQGSGCGALAMFSMDEGR